MVSLTPRQIEIARYCRARLKRVFLERAGGCADAEALDQIGELCLGALRAVDDPVCAAKLLIVHYSAAALYSERCAERYATTGVDRLRQRIFRALNALQRRLYELDPGTNPAQAPLEKHDAERAQEVAAGP